MKSKTHSKKLNLGIRIILIFVSSLFFNLFFPPFKMWPLAWIFLIPFFYAIYQTSSKQSFFLGWLFVWGASASGIYSLFHALHYNTNAGLPGTMAIIMVGLGFFGLYTGFFALGANKIMKLKISPIVQGLSISSLWIIMEFCRSYLLSGFPWALLAYSQYENLRLIQIADITGVYGISFIIALTNYSLFTIITNLSNIRLSYKPLVLSILILGVILIYGNIRLSQFDSYSKPSTKKQIALIQTNIFQDEKWAKENKGKHLLRFIDLTEKNLKKGAKLIIWPETAVIIYLQENISEELTNLLSRYNASLITGGMRYEGIPGTHVIYYNSAFHINENGILNFQDKRHIFPFSEYTPFGIDLLKHAQGPPDLSPGEESVIFTPPEGKCGILVCVDAFFPKLNREFVKQGANFLVNISNDAYVSMTNIHHRNFIISIFRAIEFRRPLLRTSNMGIAGSIDSTGRIIDMREPFEEGYVLCNPKSEKSMTFYCRFGDVFLVLCFVGLVVLFINKKRIGYK